MRADEYNFIAEIIRRLRKREAVTQADPCSVRIVIAQPSFLRSFPQARAGQPRGSRSQAGIGSGSRKRPVPAHDGIQVRIEPGNTPIIGSSGREKRLVRQRGVRPSHNWMGYDRLFGHQYDSLLQPYCLGQGLILCRFSGTSKEGIKHNHLTAISSQSFQQLRVPTSVPGLSARLLVIVVSVIVHGDRHDVVADCAPAKPEQVIVTCVHPLLAQGRFPKKQATKHR